tara:strand:- start:173 stop:538 length:366 start_codon:yes stop_codon:yes gene_type:complete
MQGWHSDDSPKNICIHTPFDFQHNYRVKQFLEYFDERLHVMKWTHDGFAYWEETMTPGSGTIHGGQRIWTSKYGSHDMSDEPTIMIGKAPSLDLNKIRHVIFITDKKMEHPNVIVVNATEF